MQLRQHHTPTPAPTRTGRAGARLAVTFAAGAALLLGACGDDVATPDTAGTATADDGVAPGTTPDAGGAAAGIEPAEPCGLLDVATVDGWLGTSGVSASTDTSLGLMGCRWATAPTDVPALFLGYDGQMAFEEVRDRACEGETPTPMPAAGPEAVACFGAVIARASTGVVIVSVEDMTGTFDEAAQLDIAATAAADAVS